MRRKTLAIGDWELIWSKEQYLVDKMYYERYEEDVN